MLRAPHGGATTIAIFAEGDLTQVIKDLRVAETVNQLPQVRANCAVGWRARHGADEWDLDHANVTGMAGTVAAQLIYDTTSLTDSDVALMFNKFAHQNTRRQAARPSFVRSVRFLDGSMLVTTSISGGCGARADGFCVDR